jgi:hypothetical protein
VPLRRRDVGAKRLCQRLDQRLIGQNAVDVGGGNDAQRRFSGTKD